MHPHMHVCQPSHARLRPCDHGQPVGRRICKTRVSMPVSALKTANGLRAHSLHGRPMSSTNDSCMPLDHACRAVHAAEARLSSPAPSTRPVMTQPAPQAQLSAHQNDMSALAGAGGDSLHAAVAALEELQQQAPAPAPPRTARLRIQRKLAAGGFATVYRGTYGDSQVSPLQNRCGVVAGRAPRPPPVLEQQQRRCGAGAAAPAGWCSPCTLRAPHCVRPVTVPDIGGLPRASSRSVPSKSHCAPPSALRSTC